MRINLLLLTLILIASTSMFAQPSNDECATLTDLGVIPYCPDTEFFTNVDATETDIGNANFPTGCIGGDITFSGRDVFFQFTTDATTVDYTITVTGITDGMGSTPMMNPQVAVYRGDCLFDELSLLNCGKAANGDAEISIDILGLDPNTPYFIRVNDWSATASPNSGTFKLCVKELDPIYIMGEDTAAGACQGTLYDSGGPDNDYQNNETHVFTVCPDQVTSCIAVNIDFFQTENNFDFLTMYAGDNTSAPIVFNQSGAITNPYEIQVSGGCVTFEFDSDGSGLQPGFELTWACNAAACNGSSVDNPTVLPGPIPIDLDGETTCNDASNFAASPCQNDGFLNGPEYVYEYNAPGGFCVSILLENAEPGTGVLVLDGPPEDPNTDCVASSENGSIASANMEEAGTYYIVVANADGCTDFDLLIEETECSFSTSLEDALCNPLNACEINMDGTPNQFPFEDGFQDVENVVGVNNGCWFGVGFQPDYVWFSVEIQQDGPFGFILSSAGTPSDIDFNVWGPFTSEEVCETPEDIIDFITNNQPIRSSYAGFALPTGLTDIHPDDGYPITDEYDCDGVGVENNDQFVRTVDGITGEHYLVLFNDFGDDIEGVVNVDWGPSGDGVLDIDLNMASGADTVVCAGEAVQLALPEWIDSIQWLAPTNGTLSCTDCLTPIATPNETTEYYAYVEALCVEDTVKVSVFVYDVALGEDITVCLGEDVELSPNVTYGDVTYNWTGPNLSCTTCPLAVVSTDTPGTFEYTIEQVSATCSLFDTILIEVLPSPAPTFEVAENATICIGDMIEIGNANNNPTFTYNWTSAPTGFNSSDINPEVSPTENTTYYIEVTSGLCPVSSFDSVLVSIDFPAEIDLQSDTLVCQSESVLLGFTMDQPGVTYAWSPTTGLDDPAIANPTATVETTTEYILTSNLGVCTSMDTVEVTATVISIEILQPDTLAICQGDIVNLNADVSPATIMADWTTDNGSFTGTGNQLTDSPEGLTTYFATANVPGCQRADTLVVLVDSIPSPTTIMPSDTAVCRGALVVLSSQAYLPGDYPAITHEWTPNVGFESGDSLYNMVIRAADTTWYYRTTINGGCISIDSALVSILETTTIDITPADPIICENSTIDLTASSPDITEFEWTTDANITDPESATVTLTAGGGPATIELEVEGEFLGCPVVEQISVTVVASPNSGIQGNALICAGESVDLVGNPDPNATYSWTADPGPLGFDIDDNNPTVMPAQTTTYTLTTSNGICPDEVQTITVEVPDGASFSSLGEDITICLLPADSVIVQLSAEGNSSQGASYDWVSDPEGLTSTQSNPSFTFSEPGVTLFEVTFTDGCGEMITETVSVTVHQGVDVQEPAITLAPLPEGDENYKEGDPVNLSAITVPETGTYNYVWVSNGDTISTIANPGLILVDSTYNFDVTVTDENGCSDSGSSETIFVDKPVWVLPNAFTPDGDGQNDNFGLLVLGQMTIESFEIWNRWGQKVYSGTDEAGWNGTFKDKPAPMDVYIYNIVLRRPSGEIQEQKGNVTLIR